MLFCVQKCRGIATPTVQTSNCSRTAVSTTTNCRRMQRGVVMGGGRWCQAGQSQTLLGDARQKAKRPWAQVTAGESLFCEVIKVAMKALSTGTGAHRGDWVFSKLAGTRQQATRSVFEGHLALRGSWIKWPPEVARNLNPATILRSSAFQPAFGGFSHDLANNRRLHDERLCPEGSTALELSSLLRHGLFTLLQISAFRISGCRRTKQVLQRLVTWPLRTWRKSIL